MLKKVKKTIQEYTMLNPGERIGIAVSGGPDSIALLHCMAALSLDYDLTLQVLHLNHGIRDREADGEEEFVRNLCHSMKIPFDSRKISIPALRSGGRGSLEDIGRRERYRYFEAAANTYELNKVALGHNLNDQAETIIMKLLRGSGLEGLKGMLPVRSGRYIRPLIEITRTEILQFLEREDKAYVIDSSNKEDIYLRNKVRNRLIPRLQEYNPKLIENIDTLSRILRVENEFIERSVWDLLSKWNVNPADEEITVHIPAFNSIHSALQFRLMKMLLKDGLWPKKEITYVHVKSVIDLMGGDNPNGVLHLPAGVTVAREYENLTVMKGRHTPAGIVDSASHKNKKHIKDDKWNVNDYYYNVNIPGCVKIREAGLSISFDLVDVSGIAFTADRTSFIDFDAVEFPLVVRNMKPGDRIQPLGLKGTKKVKSVFIDMKVPRDRRRKIPLLVDQRSVLWIPGITLNDRVKITNNTEKVIKAEIN